MDKNKKGESTISSLNLLKNNINYSLIWYEEFMKKLIYSLTSKEQIVYNEEINETEEKTLNSINNLLMSMKMN